MSFKQAALQIGSGAKIDYITGWSLKKILDIVVKLVAIALAAVFSALLYLEVQKVVTVNWSEIQSQSSNTLNFIAYSAVISGPNDQNMGQIIDTLGISFALPMGVAFVAAFVKG